MVLLKYSHAFDRRNFYGALIRINLSTKDLQQRGFTSAIRSNYSITIPFCEIQIHLFKQNPLAIRKCYIFYTDHSLKIQVGKGNSFQWMVIENNGLIRDHRRFQTEI